jgi:cobalt-zinc-cadmium efflux system outer membrane protein
MKTASNNTTKALQALFFLVFAHCSLLAQSAQTLRMAEVEERMATANLQVIAAKYGVEAARGAIVQAGLLPNPNIAIEQSAYNPRTGEFFHIIGENASNTEVALQQLILTAGKRDAAIALAITNAETGEFAVQELLRGLRYAVRGNIVDLYFTREAITFYDSSLAGVRKTVQAAERMYSQRTILLSEVLRLKSLLFTLENERLGLVSTADTLQSVLRLLLRDTTANASYIPILDRTVLDGIRAETFNLADLLKQARERRSDVLLAERQKTAAERNLSLQNALATPDVAVGARYSRSGSTFPDYFAVTAAIDIPVFNRNQGNIQTAQALVLGQDATLENTKRGAEQDVIAAYRLSTNFDRLYRSFDRSFVAAYQDFVRNMTESYEKRNVSLVEFTDFYESYRTSMLQMNHLQQDRADALEQLNYSVGAIVAPLR